MWKSYRRFKLTVNRLLNSLVKVLDINDANDVIKPARLQRTLYDVLWRHKNVSTERHISNAYTEETLHHKNVSTERHISNAYKEETLVLKVQSVFVTVLHLEYPQMGLILLPEHI